MRRIPVILTFICCLLASFTFCLPSASADMLIGACGNPLDPNSDGPLEISSPFDDPRPDHVDGIHGGVDIPCDAGSPVYAVCDGEIETYASSGIEGYQGWIVLKATEDSMGQDGTLYFIYGHCIPAGDLGERLSEHNNRVSRGEYLGNVYRIGRSTGSHLHFAVQTSLDLTVTKKIDPGLFCPSIPASKLALQQIGALGGTPMKWDPNYNFGKLLSEMVTKIIDACVKALDILKDTLLKIFIIFITIDLSLGLSMLMVDSKRGDNWFTWLLHKLILYGILLYFLENWAGFLANSMRDFFVTLGGGSVGFTYADAVNAITNPFALLQKGASIISPMVSELNHYNNVHFSMGSQFGAVGFISIMAIIIFALLSIITFKIILAYVEFYMMMLLGFVTFVTSGLKQLRYLSNSSINAICACSINLMFWCIFSLCLQLMMTHFSYEPIFTVKQADQITYATEGGDDIFGGEEGLELFSQAIRTHESGGRYNVYNGDITGEPSPGPTPGHYAYGAYQFLGIHRFEDGANDFADSGGFLDEDINLDFSNSPLHYFAEYDEVKKDPPYRYYPYTPNNQDNVAEFQMMNFYQEYGSWHDVAVAWHLGPLYHDQPDTKYWQEVLRCAKGGLLEIKIINYGVLFEIVIYILIFMMLGDRFEKDVIQTFRTGGFRFSQEGE